MGAHTAFSWRIVLHAVKRTAGVYRSQIEGLGGQVVITAVALAITASTQGGWLAVLKEASTYYTIILANLAWIALLFFWHLWLTPYELVLQEFKKALRPPLESFTAPPAPPPKPKPEFNFTPLRLKQTGTSMIWRGYWRRLIDPSGNLTLRHTPIKRLFWMP